MKNLNLKAIAVLGAAIAALSVKAKGTDLEKDASALQDQLKAHEAELTQLDATVKTLNDTIAEERKVAADTIKELKAELETALDVKLSKTDKLVITINKVRYVINHGAHPYTANQLAENEDACKAILKIEGQNAITKL